MPDKTKKVSLDDSDDISNREIGSRIEHLENQFTEFEKHYSNLFLQLNEKVETIYKKVYGNGEQGMTVTLALIDAKIDHLKELVEANYDTMKELKATVPTKWLARNWKTILFVLTTFFLILHSMIPADMPLWTFFSKILGSP